MGLAIVNCISGPQAFETSSILPGANLHFEAWAAMAGVQWGAPMTLDGVAAEWEANATLRARYRDHRRLFQARGNPDDYEPKAHVREAAFNHKVLHPIIKRLGLFLDEDGGFQLFTIAQVESEIFGSSNHDLLCIILVV